MIRLLDLAHKGLIGVNMAQELVDKGFVSIMDIRGHRIGELYGARRPYERECRRLRKTLKDMGLIWTRYIDFDKGVESFAMAAFDQMCENFSDVEGYLRQELVHAHFADFCVRHFPEALFWMFEDLPDTEQIRCRSALLLFANRIYRHARERGVYKEYEKGMLYLQSQAMVFSRTGRFKRSPEQWQSFVSSCYDWLAYYYFSSRELELVRQLGIRMPEVLDIESIRIDTGQVLPLALKQRIVAFVYKLRRCYDRYSNASEGELREACDSLPLLCLSEDRQHRVAQLKRSLGYLPRLFVLVQFLADSPSVGCRYWYYRLSGHLGFSSMSRPYLTPADWAGVERDRSMGQRLWQQWLTNRYQELLADRGVKLSLSGGELSLLQGEGLSTGLYGLSLLLSLIYRVDYAHIGGCEVLVRRELLPDFEVSRVVKWAVTTHERLPQGVTTSVDEALVGVPKTLRRRLLPLVEAACRKYHLPLPDAEGELVASTGSRLIRDKAAELLHRSGSPMALPALLEGLAKENPELAFPDERGLRDLLLHDTRFIALKRTGYYGLSEGQAEGRMSILQRLLALLRKQSRPLSVFELWEPLRETHPALALRNLRAILRAAEVHEVVAYGLECYGVVGVSYEGYWPLSVSLPKEAGFECRFAELKGFVALHRSMPLVEDAEGVRLALWWNRLKLGLTKLSTAQRKQVLQLEGWIHREGIPRTAGERLFRDRCLELADMAQKGVSLPEGELRDWLREQYGRRTGVHGVCKRYWDELNGVLKEHGLNWVV